MKMDKSLRRSLILGRIMLIPILPGSGALGSNIEGAARSFTDSLTRIYEQNIAKYKELKDFWSNPDERIREFVLRGQEGGVRSIDRR